VQQWHFSRPLRVGSNFKPFSRRLIIIVNSRLYIVFMLAHSTATPSAVAADLDVLSMQQQQQMLKNTISSIKTSAIKSQSGSDSADYVSRKC
jgi:hypothetical protein